MNLTKIKYVDCNLVINYNAPFIQVYDWGFVRINLDLVSEIVEYNFNFYYETYINKKTVSNNLMESFECFAFGKKILLLETKKENLKLNLQKIKIEKIIMNNGNEYYTII